MEQDDFINQALAIETDLNPYDLLDYLHEIEAKLLRKRLVVWGPRTIDLDILYFDHLKSEDPKLTLPHPEIMNRLFVLIPLKEIIDPHFYAYFQIVQAIEQLEKSQDQRIDRVVENERN